MISEKQKEALKAVLELHKDNKMTDEQVLTVIEALTENLRQSIQYYPWITKDTFTVPEYPWYKTTWQPEPVVT